MQRRKREVRGVDVGGGKRGRLRTETKMRGEERREEGRFHGRAVGRGEFKEKLQTSNRRETES
jgi:hypothetical protein